MKFIALISVRATIFLLFASSLYFEATRPYGLFISSVVFIGFVITEVLGRKNAIALQYSGLYIFIKWLWFAFDERD